MFEHSKAPEAPKSREVLMSELLTLQSEATRLENAIETSKENAGDNVVLGSEEHRDFGYTAELTEVKGEISTIEAVLNDMDDVDAAQRKLII